MKNDFFHLTPSSAFTTSLSEGYDGIDTYLDLEYDGHLTAEVKTPLEMTVKQPLSYKMMTTVFVATALLLTACSTGIADNPAANKTSDVQIEKPARTDGVEVKIDRTVTLSSDLSNIEDFKHSLNQYVVRLSIPASLATNIRIKRTHLNTNEVENVDTTSIQMNGASAVLTESLNLNGDVLTAQHYKYELSTYTQDLQPVEFSIKPDLLVDGEVHLQNLILTNDSLDLAALIIAPNATLITEGRNFLIKVSTLVSQGGTIESFTEADAAKPNLEGLSGKNGGQLVIRAQYYKGPLAMAMRGQKGGKGVDGIPITVRPAQAGPGHDSHGGSDCWPTTPEANSMQCLCRDDDMPTDGQPGIKGFPGNIGQNGSPGGDSGYVEFTADNGDSTSLTHIEIPGAGGEPGQGSQGGDGGDGGRGGTAPRGSDCDVGTTPGPHGPQGDHGGNGNKGPDGATQISTITINGKRL